MIKCYEFQLLSNRKSLQGYYALLTYYISFISKYMSCLIEIKLNDKAGMI